MVDSNNRGSATGINRRKFLKVASAGVGVSGLAGCSGTPFGGGGSDETISVGGLYPLSGPYGGPGQKMQQGVQVGIELARENNDAGDREITFSDADSQAEPDTGRQRAQELINDGVDIIVGTYSASVEKSVVELADDNEVLTATFGVAPSTFQEDCSLYHFAPASPIWKQDHAVLGHALREGMGESVYTISANYSWGQTHRDNVENVVAPKYDAEYLGNTFTELGQGDYSQALTEAEESGADIIYSPTAGGDMVQMANQAGEFGLLEDIVFMWPVGGLTVAQQIDPSVITHENFYTGLGWYWQLDNEPTNTYVQNYRDRADDVPSWPSAIIYSALRTLLNSVRDVGSVDTAEVARATEGAAINPQLWSRDEYFRECNHANMFPYYLARGKENPEGSDYYELVATIDDYDEIYRTCEETGCNIPDS